MPVCGLLEGDAQSNVGPGQKPKMQKGKKKVSGREPRPSSPGWGDRKISLSHMFATFS